MSVFAPTLRAKSSVASKDRRRISPKPKRGENFVSGLLRHGHSAVSEAGVARASNGLKAARLFFFFGCAFAHGGGFPRDRYFL